MPDEIESPAPLQSKHVVQLDENGFFVGMVMVDEDPMERGTFQLPPLAIDISPPVIQDGQRAQWLGESWIFHDANPDPSPEQYRPLAILNIDLDVDRIYAQVIGLRGPEYEMAEDQARAFLADTNQPPPQSVTDWASIKGWTPEVAAQNIVTQAEAWRGLSLLTIRPARLQIKEQLRTAETFSEMKTLMAVWATNVSVWRTTLGLPN